MPMVCPLNSFIHSHHSLMTLTVDNVVKDGDMYCVFPNSEDRHVATFSIDDLKDIAEHGMSSGVSGFIYTRDNVAWFNENSDEIEEYLSDWYMDNMGEVNYIGAIAQGNGFAVGSIDELKNRMVWSYVELKAHDILCQVDPNY